MWAWDITNFVWWVGIGHAGTLISAILLLLNQQWRNSINRFAEAMTHLRGGLRGHVPDSAPGPSLADVLALPVSQHHGNRAQLPQPAGVGRVRGLHLRHGLASSSGSSACCPIWPRCATAPSNRSLKVTYGILAMGWRGSAKHWAVYETASLLLAGLATPLVLSVHTVVSFDFTVGIVPGWHSTFFPPYFVAGAIYSGFAMVLALAIPLRAVYGLKGLITDQHLDNAAKVMMATGLIVGYSYIMEAFSAWYSGNVFEQAAMLEPHDRSCTGINTGF